MKFIYTILIYISLSFSFQKKEKINGLENLTDIQSLNPSIQIDIKYATTDNFMHKQLYFNINKIYLQPDVALRLSKCQKFLKKINPDYSLLVYDGVRPLSDIREIAYPSKEEYYFKLGLLKPIHIQNRKLLRKVMEYQNFRNIPTEWWHFNACSRKEAKIKYKIIP